MKSFKSDEYLNTAIKYGLKERFVGLKTMYVKLYKNADKEKLVNIELSKQLALQISKFQDLKKKMNSLFNQEIEEMRERFNSQKIKCDELEKENEFYSQLIFDLEIKNKELKNNLNQLELFNSSLKINNNANQLDLFNSNLKINNYLTENNLLMGESYENTGKLNGDEETCFIRNTFIKNKSFENEPLSNWLCSNDIKVILNEDKYPSKSFDLYKILYEIAINKLDFLENTHKYQKNSKNSFKQMIKILNEDIELMENIDDKNDSINCENLSNNQLVRRSSSCPSLDAINNDETSLNINTFNESKNDSDLTINRNSNSDSCNSSKQFLNPNSFLNVDSLSDKSSIDSTSKTNSNVEFMSKHFYSHLNFFKNKISRRRTNIDRLEISRPIIMLEPFQDSTSLHFLNKPNDNINYLSTLNNFKNQTFQNENRLSAENQDYIIDPRLKRFTDMVRSNTNKELNKSIIKNISNEQTLISSSFKKTDKSVHSNFDMLNKRRNGLAGVRDIEQLTKFTQSPTLYKN